MWREIFDNSIYDLSRMIRKAIDSRGRILIRDLR